MLKRIIIPVMLLAALASGAFALKQGTADGAVKYNRVSTTCAKAGFDLNYFRKQVDPIVAFGQPQSAHLHDFFGLVNIVSTFSAGTYGLRPGHEDDPGYEPRYSNCPFYGDWPL